jgi:ribosomal protein S18 acetylase RimI-like enzyme
MTTPTIHLVPIDSWPDGRAFVDGLLAREAKWFHFPGGFHHGATNDQECNLLALEPAHEHSRACYDDPGPSHGKPSLICGKWAGERGPFVGFGRLWFHPQYRVLVASYAVDEAHRRRGVGRAILQALHEMAKRRQLGLICAVLKSNAPSLALCEQHFGPSLFEGEAPGATELVVCFGDERAVGRIFADEAQS